MASRTTASRGRPGARPPSQTSSTSRREATAGWWQVSTAATIFLAGPSSFLAGLARFHTHRRCVVAGAPWNDVRMNCSYNNGLQSCMGSCVNHEMGADALAFQRTVAARSAAANLRSLMYGPLPPELPAEGCRAGLLPRAGGLSLRQVLPR